MKGENRMNFLKKKERRTLIAKILVAISVLAVGTAYNFSSTKSTPVYAATTPTITINNLTYSYSGTTASVTDSTATGSIVIPSTITVNGRIYNVTSINDWAFDNGYSQQVTSVTIPNSVTYIGDFAFDDTYITSLTIPNSVRHIGSNCFYNCCKLVSVTLPNSITSINPDTFTNCSSLKSVTIPSSVTSIGDGAFLQCTSLTSVTISNSVTYIGNIAFQSCTSLTSITIPSSVTSMGGSAFDNCTGVKTIYFENGNPNPYDSSFDCISSSNFGCPNAQTVKVGNTIYNLNKSNLTATTSAHTSDLIYIKLGTISYRVITS